MFGGVYEFTTLSLFTVVDRIFNCLCPAGECNTRVLATRVIASHVCNNHACNGHACNSRACNSHEWWYTRRVCSTPQEIVVHANTLREYLKISRGATPLHACKNEVIIERYRMSAKNSGLSIVGSVKHNCCCLRAESCMSSILSQTVTYEKSIVSIDLIYKYCRIDRHHCKLKPSPTTTK